MSSLFSISNVKYRLSDVDLLGLDILAYHSEDVDTHWQSLDSLNAVDFLAAYEASHDVEHLQCTVAADNDVAAVLVCEDVVFVVEVTAVSQTEDKAVGIVGWSTDKCVLAFEEHIDILTSESVDEVHVAHTGAGDIGSQSISAEARSSKS